jgi:hypothetical protein
MFGCPPAQVEIYPGLFVGLVWYRIFGGAVGCMAIPPLHAPRDSKARAIAANFTRHLHQW